LLFQTEISENIFTSKLINLSENKIKTLATELSELKWILKTCNACNIYLDLVYALAYDKLTRTQLKNHLSYHSDVKNSSGSGLNDTYKAKLKIFFTEFINKVNDVKISKKYPIPVANDPTITTKENPILAKPTDSPIRLESSAKITPLSINKVAEEDDSQSSDDEEELQKKFREEILIPQEKQAAELAKLKKEAELANLSEKVEQIRLLQERQLILKKKKEELAKLQEDLKYSQSNPHLDKDHILSDVPPPLPWEKDTTIPLPVPWGPRHNLGKQQPLPPNLANIRKDVLNHTPGSRVNGRRGGKFRRSKSTKNKTKRRHK